MGCPAEKSPYAVRSGLRIKALRKSLGWSQKQLSEATGNKLSASRIANYEQGLRELGIMEAETLAEALRVIAGYLCGFTNLRWYISKEDYDILTDLRALPENVRREYAGRIHSLAMAYKVPVADERTGEFAHKPSESGASVHSGKRVKNS